jgi:murein DD-endopeptidase MepM/ murein hydrolase activator NlpD
MSGIVIFTGVGGSYGNLTKIQHGGGVQTWYAHQSDTDVEAGDTVTAGQIIGRVGMTGNTTGPHLHLEVRARGLPVDPERWLNARGVAP